MIIQFIQVLYDFMTERKTVLSLYAKTMYFIQFCTTPSKTIKMLSFDYLQSSKQYLALLTHFLFHSFLLILTISEILVFKIFYY